MFFFSPLLHIKGRYLHRGDESNLFGRWHAHSSGQPIPRQPGPGGVAEPVPEPERQRGDFRAAGGPRARPGGDFHRAVERAVQQAAAEAVARVGIAI